MAKFPNLNFQLILIFIKAIIIILDYRITNYNKLH